MKTARNTVKNICKISPFLGVRKHIRIIGPEMPWLSGVLPLSLSKIRPEIAVNMAEFPQLIGVPL